MTDPLTNEEAALKMLHALGNNPATRKDFLGLVKKVDPNKHIPEIDNMKPVEDRLTKMDENIGKLVKVVVNDRQDRELEKRRATLKSERHYTDDGVKAVEEFMVANDIRDHFIAADALEKRQPAAAPERPSFSTRAFFGEKQEGGADWSNPEQALDKEIDNALKEVSSGGFRG
jgi:hypothetical protein